MPMLTPQFADLLDARFRKDFYGFYAQYTQVAPQVLNVKSSDRNFEKETGVSGMETIPVKTEASDTTYEDSVQLYDKTYTHLTYAKGFKISQEMIEDDMTSAMRERPKTLSEAVARTRDTLGANIFNNGFADTGPDGVSLFNDSHPGYGSRTFDNLGTAATLSHTAVMTARTRMQKMEDHKGQPIRIDPKILLVPVDLEEDAYIITKTERVPGSANWDKNLLDSRGLETILWRFLSSTTAWFLLAPKGQHRLTRFDRIKPQFNRDGEFDKDVMKMKTRFRVSHGYPDWRGVDGNVGA